MVKIVLLFMLGEFDDVKLLPPSNYQQIKEFRKRQFAFFGTFWTFFGIVLMISESHDENFTQRMAGC